MSLIRLSSFSFTYPLAAQPALDSVSAEIQRGDFCLVAGRSGCGKTTLLKHLKPAIAPHGDRTGEVLFDGTDIFGLPERDAAEKIAFVAQFPEEQIVTDTVRHELAFGMCNLGYDKREVAVRSARICNYLGISQLYRRKTAELSGGEKQLVNLAAALTLRPEVIVLDEPTAQLDPVGSDRLIDALARLNRETGVTVIMSSHKTAGLIDRATRLIYMDGGKAVFCGSVRAGIKQIADDNFTIMLPAYTRLGRDLPEGKIPLSVPEAISAGIAVPERREPGPMPDCRDAAVSLKDVSFRYSGKSPDVLRDLSGAVPKGKFTAVTGGNGSGKSTLMKLIAGIYKPSSGKLKVSGKTALLPQDAALLFTEKTVGAELKNAPADPAIDISDVADRNPLDLSGGELERAALALVLAQKPDILLLDEPTKGTDCLFRQSLGRLLRSLCESGVTVIAVSHDTEFCAEFADVSVMLFDGTLI